MPLEILIGPLNSGKTSTLLDALRASLPTQAGLLVVPDRHTATAFSRHLLETGSGAPAAVPGEALLDWPAFVAKLADARLPVISRAQAALLIHRLLSALRPPSLDATHPSLGLARQFAEAILALKSNGIDPGKFAALVREQEAATRRERDLLEVYEHYERERHTLAILDEADLVALAIRNIRGRRAPLIAPLSTFLVDEFISFAPGQIALLEAIREAHPELAIRVSFPAPEERSPHAELFAGFLARGSAALRAIADDERRLEATPRPDPPAQVISARSPAQEARHAAKLVAELAANGATPGDVVVAASPGDGFLAWFATEAEAMGMLRRHPPLEGVAASPFVHALLAPDVVAELPEMASVAGYAKALRAQAIGAETVASWSHLLARHPVARRSIARNAAAAEKLADALARLESTAALLRLGAVCREDFIRMLAEALPSGAGAAAHEVAFPFRLSPPWQSMALAARAVIVPRMTEGHIPRRAPELPFFAGWRDAGIAAIFPGAADAYAAEAFAFETLVAKCRGVLTLLSPVVDEDGSETLRSAFADRFLAPGAPPAYAAPIVPTPAAATQSNWEERLDRLLAVEEARTTGGSPVPGFMGELSQREALSLTAQRFGEHDVRVTALERYASCPFIFFIEDVLGARELPDETPEMRAADRGSLVHELLRRFYEDHAAEALAARGSAAAEKKIPRIVAALADAVWEANAEIVEKIAPGLRERQRRSIEQLAFQVIGAEIDEARRVEVPLAPIACEWSFGTKAGRPLAFPIAGEKPASISGRVDRIDATDDGSAFLVVDYKTGAVDPVITPIRKGLHLQLPLYVEAARRHRCPKARALGALIVDVRNARAGEEKETAGKTYGVVLEEAAKTSVRIGRKKSALDEGAFAEAMEAAGRAAATHVASIRAGRFAPAAGSDCRNCTYGDSCRQKTVAPD